MPGGPPGSRPMAPVIANVNTCHHAPGKLIALAQGQEVSGQRLC